MISTEHPFSVTSVIPHDLKEHLRSHGWCWQSAGAVVGLSLGILSPIIGSILTVVAWFTGTTWHGFSLQRYGTVLLFLTIPWLLAGAHCLDLMDKEDEKTKRSHRKYEMTRHRPKAASAVFWGRQL